MRRLGVLVLVLIATASLLAAADTLDAYFIDVEGGQATLLVTPQGESILVDSGWPGNNSRDADRILSAAKEAGVSQIDYLLVTHYHMDHVGGVPGLAEVIPIAAFVDHGPDVETGKEADNLFKPYLALREKAKHIVAKPGETLPLKGVDALVLSAGGELISKPLPGAGVANPLCASTKQHDPDPSENARSVGTLFTYGKFRLIDLGDLTWNKELELVCPDNKIGAVDVYLVTHHGMDMSGSAAIVHALHPRVAIMNNGARKGGVPSAWQIIHGSPGLEDLWQLHFAVAGGQENNAPEKFIANMSENDMGDYIKLSAKQDGSFTVTNGRNGFSRTYPPAGSRP